MTDENEPMNAADASKKTDASQEPPAQATPATDMRPSGDISGDIARILEETKLPQRTEFRAQGDAVIPKTPQTPVQETPPAKPVAPAVPTAETPIAAMRTLRADAQEAIHDENITMVRAISMEEERRRLKQTTVEAPSPGDDQRRRRTFSILFASVLLLALGGGALFGVIVVLQQQKTPIADTSGSNTSLVFAEHSVALPLDNVAASQLKATLGQAFAGQSGALGSIVRIVPTITATSTGGAGVVREATLGEFFSALKAGAPPDLVRALGDTFFFGIHTANKSVPVFIIPVHSYDRAFAGMLAWEKTIDTDLTPIVPFVSPYMAGADGLPTDRTFQDLTIQNYDTRALKDDSGAIVLYYTFPNQNFLIIAQSQLTLAEVLSRLQARREI